MTISLEKWIAQTQDEGWAIDVLSQNRIHDDIIGKDDFILRFGRTATDAVWPEIEAALTQQAKSAFKLAIEKITTQSEQVLADKFMGCFRSLENIVIYFGST